MGCSMARTVWFNNVRVEISCPKGIFTIDGFGDGALNTGALSTASLELSLETRVSGLPLNGAVFLLLVAVNNCPGIRCNGGWGLWCWLVTHLAPASFVRERLPTILARASGQDPAWDDQS